MPGIVCAIRGGPGSNPTIDKAVELAKEINEQLSFLFVVNLEFLAQTLSSRVATLSEQMHQMGEFILLNAQSRAEKQGVEAATHIGQGKVVDSIIDLCKELEARYVVIGRPRKGEGESPLSHSDVGGFLERLKQECGAKVILAD
ncbi:MAG: universal stress protein [Anaerolineales bacterium]|jgi:nucleotide-binding universal stress UspA family protein